MSRGDRGDDIFLDDVDGVKLEFGPSAASNPRFVGYGELRQESAEAKAERIVQEELKRLGWKEKDLPVRRQSDPEKLAMVARLSTETILSIPRMAVRLHLGSAKSAKAKLASWMKTNTRQSAQPPAETGKIDRKL